MLAYTMVGSLGASEQNIRGKVFWKAQDDLGQKQACSYLGRVAECIYTHVCTHPSVQHVGS